MESTPEAVGSGAPARPPGLQGSAPVVSFGPMAPRGYHTPLSDLPPQQPPVPYLDHVGDAQANLLPRPKEGAPGPGSSRFSVDTLSSP